MEHGMEELAKSQGGKKWSPKVALSPGQERTKPCSGHQTSATQL